MNLFLKFNSKEEADFLLYTNGNPNYRNTDIIGKISKPTGNVVTVNSIEYQEMQDIDGWHVNVLLAEDEEPSNLLDFVVSPNTPSRVWG